MSRYITVRFFLYNYIAMKWNPLMRIWTKGISMYWFALWHFYSYWRKQLSTEQSWKCNVSFEVGWPFVLYSQKSYFWLLPWKWRKNFLFSLFDWTKPNKMTYSYCDFYSNCSSFIYISWSNSVDNRDNCWLHFFALLIFRTKKVNENGVLLIKL